MPCPARSLTARSELSGPWEEVAVGLDVAVGVSVGDTVGDGVGLGGGGVGLGVGCPAGEELGVTHGDAEARGPT